MACIAEGLQNKLKSFVNLSSKHAWIANEWVFWNIINVFGSGEILWRGSTKFSHIIIIIFFFDSFIIQKKTLFFSKNSQDKECVVAFFKTFPSYFTFFLSRRASFSKSVSIAAYYNKKGIRLSIYERYSLKTAPAHDNCAIWHNQSKIPSWIISRYIFWPFLNSRFLKFSEVYCANCPTVFKAASSLSWQFSIVKNKHNIKSYRQWH